MHSRTCLEDEVDRPSLPAVHRPQPPVKSRVLPPALTSLVGQPPPLGAAVVIRAEPFTHGTSVASALAMSEIEKLFPDGHFYSPLCNPTELEGRSESIWPAGRPQPPFTPGIDYRVPEQLRWMDDVSRFTPEVDFPRTLDEEPLRYAYANDQYPGLDAEFLYCMLRHLKPRRVIEVGSGFSTLITAEVNRRHFDHAMQFTCIEPYPRPFVEILKRRRLGLSHCIIDIVQAVGLDTFGQLGDGDILMIDSSHVAKTGSDVAYLFQQVLPCLAPGVYIHFHDIFLPKDYPAVWQVDQGRHWNEQYVLQAFLQFNRCFEVIWGAAMMQYLHEHELHRCFPRFPDLGGGASFWVRRTGL